MGNQQVKTDLSEVSVIENIEYDDNLTPIVLQRDENKDISFALTSQKSNPLDIQIVDDFSIDEDGSITKRSRQSSVSNGMSQGSLRSFRAGNRQERNKMMQEFNQLKNKLQEKNKFDEDRSNSSLSHRKS